MSNYELIYFKTLFESYNNLCLVRDILQMRGFFKQKDFNILMRDLTIYLYS